MKKHIKILDLLRGLAALGVVLFHFSNSTLPTIKPNYLTNLFFYGQYGVQVFFVISGFVIPYSMYRANYHPTNYFKYLLKRFVRICPPSYVAILLTFILYFSAIIIVNRPIDGMQWPGVNFNSILGNLTYTVPYLNTDWFNPVFWTLAIEFQFYILIGLLLPIITARKDYLIALSFIAILLLGYINYFSFFKYGSFFVLGMILFLRKEALSSNSLLLVLTFLSFVFCFHQNNLAEFLFGLLSFVVIFLEFNPDYRITNHLGKISYSLYITHSAIGLMAEIVLKRIIPIHGSDIGKIIMLGIYTIIVIIFATIFYKLIEKPFIIYSKAVKMKNA